LSPSEAERENRRPLLSFEEAQNHRPIRQRIVRVPVENRYSFTDFSELDFRCEVGGTTVRIRPQLAPGARGHLEIPVPSGTAPGSGLKLRVTNGKAVVHESVVTLVDDVSYGGRRRREEAGNSDPGPPPPPHVGGYNLRPSWSEDEGKVLIRGDH